MPPSSALFHHRDEITSAVRYLINQGQCGVPHQHGASDRRRGSQRCCRVGPGRSPRSVRRALESCDHRSLSRAESLPASMMSTSVPPAMSTREDRLTGQRQPIVNLTARDREHRAARSADRPHHARNVSISRSTCAASARSSSSAAISSASARILAAAFRRAASMSAARTAVETGVPSLVSASIARDASSSGRNVIVSAIQPLYDKM
jgi:hypothetical protein